MTEITALRLDVQRVVGLFEDGASHAAQLRTLLAECFPILLDVLEQRNVVRATSLHGISDGSRSLGRSRSAELEGTSVHVIRAALPKNIFWQVAGLVDLGTTAHCEGVILTQTSVTLRTGASINGKGPVRRRLRLQCESPERPN